jgi:hypothetical protein
MLTCRFVCSVAMLSAAIGVMSGPVQAQECSAHEACGTGWSYAGDGEYAGRSYAMCNSGPNWLGHRSHMAVYCAGPGRVGCGAKPLSVA